MGEGGQGTCRVLWMGDFCGVCGRMRFPRAESDKDDDDDDDAIAMLLLLGTGVLACASFDDGDPRESVLG